MFFWTTSVPWVRLRLDPFFLWFIFIRKNLGFPEKITWICVSFVLTNNGHPSGFLQHSKQITVTTHVFSAVQSPLVTP